MGGYGHVVESSNAANANSGEGKAEWKSSSELLEYSAWKSHFYTWTNFTLFDYPSLACVYVPRNFYEVISLFISNSSVSFQTRIKRSVFYKKESTVKYSSANGWFVHPLEAGSASSSEGRECSLCIVCSKLEGNHLTYTYNTDYCFSTRISFFLFDEETLGDSVLET